MEEHFELLLVNARHIKAVPGRKTDVKDSEWIASLLQHGLLRPSFVPPPVQRGLRELCRHRAATLSVSGHRSSTAYRKLQKALESGNIKLSSVATDVLGVSGRSMLNALVEGQTDTAAMAELARGSMRNKREELEQALEGRVQPHHRFILKELLRQIDSLDEAINRFDAQIEADCAPFEEAVVHLNTIPGVARATAELIVSEIGTDMDRFPSPGHLAAWAGVAPGNNESAGKRLSSHVRQGNRILRAGLVQAAHAAVRTKGYLAAQYHRLAGRRGKKRAIMAVAHSILVIAYRLIQLIERGEDYKELGADYFDQRRPEVTARHLMSRLVQLGYDVTLNPKAKVPCLA